jgi:ParB family transcriptional regulator, chromosome partitioning protein
VAALVVKKGLSVRDTEAIVRQMGQPRPSAPTAAASVDPNIRRLQDDLSEKLGAAVAIEHSQGGRGRLVVKYNSLDELDGILSHIV